MFSPFYHRVANIIQHTELIQKLPYKMRWKEAAIYKSSLLGQFYKSRNVSELYTPCGNSMIDKKRSQVIKDSKTQ